MTLLGFDISLWNDDNSTSQMVNFDLARQRGISFAFIKCSQSTWADPDFIKNWYNAKLAGMPVGAYHYFTWDKSAMSQAEFMWGMLKNNLGSLFPVVDYECRTNIPSKAIAHKALTDFINRFQALSARKIAIYTSPSFWKEYGYTVDPIAAECPLWIANYGVSAPTVPLPWKNYTFWQKTDKGPGPLYGCESQFVDLNEYNGSSQQFLATFGVPPAEPVFPQPPAHYDNVRTLCNVHIRTDPIVDPDTDLKVLPAGEILEKAGDIWTSGGRDWQPVKAWIAREFVEDV